MWKGDEPDIGMCWSNCDISTGTRSKLQMPDPAAFKPPGVTSGEWPTIRDLARVYFFRASSNRHCHPSRSR
jgi:hypothetical protein